MLAIFIKYMYWLMWSIEKSDKKPGNHPQQGLTTTYLRNTDSQVHLCLVPLQFAGHK